MIYGNDGAYTDLANEIIKLSCQEYVWLNKTLKRMKVKEVEASNGVIRVYNEIQTQQLINEPLKFFNSQWFRKLTELEPEWLIKKLDEKAEEKYQKDLKKVSERIE